MNISKFKNRQEIRRVVITSFKKLRIRTLGSFMSYIWNGRQRDVVPKSVITSLTYRTHVLLIKTSWLFVVTFSLPYQGTKKCDGVQNSCFSHKTDCLFVCLFLDFFFVLHVRSCCNHGNLPTVLSLRWRLWVQRVFSPNREPNIPLISVIFFTWVYPQVLETDETRISDQKIRKIFCTWSSHPQFH